MTTTERERALGEQVRAALDADADHLDAATLSRLTRARHVALDRMLASGGGRQRWAALGLAASLAVAVWWLPRSVEVPPAPPVAPETFAMLASDDDLALLNDLEVLLWAESAEAPE